MGLWIRNLHECWVKGVKWSMLQVCASAGNSLTNAEIRGMKTMIFSAKKNCITVEKHLYLFVYLLCRLGITESHGGQIFEDWHLHGAVAPIQQRHQGARVHRPIHNLGPNTCRETGREETELIIYLWHKQSSELQEEAVKSRKCTQRQTVLTQAGTVCFACVIG